jgi:hypothetical protein
VRREHAAPIQSDFSSCIRKNSALIISLIKPLSV